MNWLFPIVGLVLGLSACGSSAEGHPPIRPVADSYAVKYLGGDVSAFDLVSDRCQKSIGEDTFKDVVKVAGLLDESPEYLSWKEKVNGDTGTVTYTMTNPKFNATNQHWIYEAGTWHWDGC